MAHVNWRILQVRMIINYYSAVCDGGETITSNAPYHALALSRMGSIPTPRGPLHAPQHFDACSNVRGSPRLLERNSSSAHKDDHLWQPTSRTACLHRHTRSSKLVIFVTCKPGKESSSLPLAPQPCSSSITSFYRGRQTAAAACVEEIFWIQNASPGTLRR